MLDYLDKMNHGLAQLSSNAAARSILSRMDRNTRIAAAFALNHT